MEPQEGVQRALGLTQAGDLQGAIDILDPVIEEFREYGPAYTLHARVFLMAGDCAQPLVDLDAAEWANREYGTDYDMIQVVELRALTYAIRSIYGGQKDTPKCVEQVDELMRNRVKPATWWFLPAACHELNYQEEKAREWVEKLANLDAFQSAASFYFTKRAGLTQLLAMPKNPEELIPVHYARHFRARREGDLKAAEKYRKRMSDLIPSESPWSIVDLYAAGKVVVAAV